MTLGDQLVEVWRQLLVEERTEIDLPDARSPVGRTRQAGLRTVSLRVGDLTLEGIEQNPATKSRWAQMARDGQRIVQFRARGRYVANVCEGKLTRYSAWGALGLPD